MPRHQSRCVHQPFAHIRHAQPLCSRTLLKPLGRNAMSELRFLRARTVTNSARPIHLANHLGTYPGSVALPPPPEGSKPRKNSLTGAPTSRQSVMLLSTSTVSGRRSVRPHPHMFLSETGAPALLRCHWHFVPVLPALVPRLAPSASRPPLCLCFRRWRVRKMGRKQFRSSSPPSFVVPLLAPRRRAQPFF